MTALFCIISEPESLDAAVKKKTTIKYNKIAYYKVWIINNNNNNNNDNGNNNNDNNNNN